MKPYKQLVSLFFLVLASTAFSQVDDYFNQIKTKPSALYEFLKKMPKGGELHYHLAGGASTPAMLKLAASKPYCINNKTFDLSSSKDQCVQATPSKQLLKDPDLYQKTAQAWSMQDFVSGAESNADHFFNSFGKFIPLVSDHTPELLVDVLKRAGKQNELYLEIMVIPDDAQSLAFGQEIATKKSFKAKQERLLADPKFQKNIRLTQEKAKQDLQLTRKTLGCDSTPQQSACQITVKFQYYVLREQPLDNLFAQALNGFEAAAGSDDIIAVNIVQPEHNPITLKNYRQQMKIFNFLHKAYPQVHIALHAGELAPNLVAASDLKFHIRDAVLKGKAQRIGHGVDIQHEDDHQNTVKYMAEKQIPVEINLSSNQTILAVHGKEHPLNFYLKNRVPVVLSTDDEGILGTNLTEQYLKAALEHHLDYSSLKQINRNALTYNFLSGASLWKNPSAGIPVNACKQLDSRSCLSYIKNNPKATLQWQLEKRLQQFEIEYQNERF